MRDVAVDDLAALLADWQVWARDDQLPSETTPEGKRWRTWLVLGGRGAGKTRAGAEWVRAQALGLPPLADAPVGRIALVAETQHEARAVMVEGVSGLLAVHADEERPLYEPSRRQLTWPNGAIAQLYSAEDPDGLRGPQFAAAWCDELAKWPDPQRTWDNLQFALRLGTAPRQVVTTTPRAIALIEALIGETDCVTTRARTGDNAAHLAPAFLDAITRRYAGTALGRQELEGEIVREVVGALWRQAWIEAARVRRPPELRRIVVAVDPPVTATARSDACGIVVAGKGEDGRAYVLADRSVQGRSPADWAGAAVAAWRDYKADCIVVEVNQGGDLVAGVLKSSGPDVPVRQVRATRGKWVRAEPVAAIYAEGRASHVGTFAELEAEMTSYGADGFRAGASPDRLDALVWALTELMLAAEATRPSVRAL